MRNVQRCMKLLLKVTIADRDFLGCMYGIFNLERPYERSLAVMCTLECTEQKGEQHDGFGKVVYI